MPLIDEFLLHFHCCQLSSSLRQCITQFSQNLFLTVVVFCHHNLNSLIVKINPYSYKRSPPWKRGYL